MGASHRQSVGLQGFMEAVKALSDDADAVVDRLRLPSGQYALNVHQYGRHVYEAFLRQHYTVIEGRVGAIAMNPGRNGAVQTGIPFTDHAWATQLGIDVVGLRGTPRGVVPAGTNEVSGRRLLAWAEQAFGDPRGMYAEILFYITCPLAILTRRPVRNVPLPELRGENARRVFDLIQRHTPRLIDASRPRGIMLLGRYAEKVWDGLERTPDVPVARTLHPAAHVSKARLHEEWNTAYGSFGPPKRSSRTQS